MGNVDNHIYLKICESSYEIFESSNYGTYRNFCKIIKTDIETNSYGAKTKERIYLISMVIDKVFSLELDENIRYIKNFFIEEKYDKLSDIIRYMKIYYPMNDNINKLI